MAPSLMQQCVSRRRGALGIPLCIPMVCIGVFVYTLMRVCIYTQWSLRDYIHARCCFQRLDTASCPLHLNISEHILTYLKIC